jgi:hypothetical protein
VPHVTGSLEDRVTRKTIHFWTKPIAELLEVSVSTYIQENKMATDKGTPRSLKSMDAVLGGDHGQRNFRSVIKIILRDNTGKQVTSMVMKVGHIDCTKDTYEVLKSSVAGPLNKSLQNVINLGALLLIRDANEGLLCRMKKNGDDPPLTIISSLPIPVFVTCDLAYFAAILGKVNMAGDWCT